MTTRSPDLLEGAPEPVGWTRRRRRAATACVLVLAVGVVAAAVGRVQDGRRERALDARLSVRAELGVDSVSAGGFGLGRVDHYAVVRVDEARGATVREVRIDQGRLRGRGRPLDGAAAQPGEAVFVPLSVRLDCSRPEPLARASELRGTVEVVTRHGRALTRPVVLAGASALTTGARTLCRLDPDRVAELSGPVGPR